MNRFQRILSATLFATLGLTAVACGGSARVLDGGAFSPNSKAPSEESAKSSAPKDAADAPSPVLAGMPMQPGMSPPPPPASAPSMEAPRASNDIGRGRSADKKSSDSSVAPEPTNRPGLGTEWGETRSSRITTVPFVRADNSNPITTASLLYNDEDGARAMASSSGFRRTPSGSFSIAHGAVTVGLRDENGSFLTGFVSGGKDFVVGESGHRYTIVLKNETGQRFECVISVDGLDVLDGKDASFAKRGYLLDPHAELEVDGFRQSMDAVAAFRFGSVRSSYANQKHGETRNVGVIGMALFNERGSSAFPWSQEEIDKRNSADPFPGRFATPPN